MMLQVVFVKWGTKYSAAYVNALVAAVLQHCSRDVRFICFTDDPKGLNPDIDTRPFPDLGVPIPALTGRGGSLCKMSMFIDGQLEHGVETIYLDLDTAVFGDVARLADCLKAKRGLYLLQRHAVPYWRFRWLMRLIAPHRYYLGNTAIMAFYPEDWTFIARDFIRDYPHYEAQDGSLDVARTKIFKGGNEMVISEAAKEASRVFPRDVAIKFTQGYMAPWLWLARLKNRLPWVKAARKRLPVLTFHGKSLKPEELIQMEPGQIVHHKYHKTEWQYPEIRQYWEEMLKIGGPI